MESIGDRMKSNYENRCKHYLIRRMPVVVRVDGKAFHTYCRGLNRPFDGNFSDSMVNSASVLAEQMQGFKAAYVQSDEASFLLTDYDELSTEAWFGYSKSKIESVSSSIMTAHFNIFMDIDKAAYFDSRSFNIPREEVANYFLWRAMDWERNSVSMYCRSFFSHKQMDGKSREDQHEMLHSIGKDWAVDLDNAQKNGTFILKDSVKTDVKPIYQEISDLITPLIEAAATRKD